MFKLRNYFVSLDSMSVSSRHKGSLVPALCSYDDGIMVLPVGADHTPHDVKRALAAPPGVTWGHDASVVNFILM
jgi:hypothetical protein